MKIHELTSPKRASKKRLGRGIGSGTGKTAGRGTKGQKARTGGNIKPGFEGGQTKLAMRLPKVRGFKARARIEYQIVNLSDLMGIKANTIDAAVLQKAGLIRSASAPVKLLGDGVTGVKATIKVTAVSKSAMQKIEQAGGKIELLTVQKKATKKASPTEVSSQTIVKATAHTGKTETKSVKPTKKADK